MERQAKRAEKGKSRPVATSGERKRAEKGKSRPVATSGERKGRKREKAAPLRRAASGNGGKGKKPPRCDGRREEKGGKREKNAFPVRRRRGILRFFPTTGRRRAVNGGKKGKSRPVATSGERKGRKVEKSRPVATGGERKRRKERKKRLPCSAAARYITLFSDDGGERREEKGGKREKRLPCSAAKGKGRKEKKTPPLRRAASGNGGKREKRLPCSAASGKKAPRCRDAFCRSDRCGVIKCRSIIRCAFSF